MLNYDTVDEYLSYQPLKTKEALINLIKCIMAAAPDATELINYNIPAFALIKNGKRDQQIMIAGFKNHVGFYPNPTTIDKFHEKLKNYKKGKGSIQFPINEPIPCELIIEMVKYRRESLMEVEKRRDDT